MTGNDPQLVEVSHRDIITSFYRTLLRREPESEGLAAYVNALQGGKPVQEILQAFVNSPEFRLKSVMDGHAAFGVSAVLVNSGHEDIRLLYPVSDKVQLPELLQGNPFQIDDLKAVFAFCKEQGAIIDDGIFMDVGANVGSSVISAMALNLCSEGFAIEPSAENLAYLRSNLALNNVQDKVLVAPVAVSDVSGSSELWRNEDNCGDYRLHDSGAEDLEGEVSAQVLETITTSTLDEIVATYDIDVQKVKFIWIDCQGSEGLIFRGGERFFDRVQAPIFTEFWPYGLKRLGCEDAFFDFVARYSRQVLTVDNGQFTRMSDAAIHDYFEQNIETRSNTDLLLLPK